jgi:endonuclease-3
VVNALPVSFGVTDVTSARHLSQRRSQLHNSRTSTTATFRIMKRSASSSIARLSSHTSPHHTSVTLFELNNRVPDASPHSSPRRSKRVKLTETNDFYVEDLHASSNPKQSAPSGVERAGSKSPRKAKPIPLSLKTPHPAPPHWRETYDTIKEMRSRIVAPVDTMGCDQAQHKETDPKVRPRLSRHLSV